MATQDATITSANSILTLIVPRLFPAPVTIQNFSTDKMFDADSTDRAEVQMSVDGVMMAGKVFNPSPLTISLSAASLSRDFFDGLIAAEDLAREIYYVHGEIVLPATGVKYALVRGVLQNAKKIPTAGKVLQPVDYKFMFERIERSLI